MPPLGRDMPPPPRLIPPPPRPPPPPPRPPRPQAESNAVNTIITVHAMNKILLFISHLSKCKFVWTKGRYALGRITGERSVPRRCSATTRRPPFVRPFAR
jgi:hypothetical protein